MPTAEANDGPAIISNLEEVSSQTVEDHAEVSSPVEPVDIPTVRRSRRLQGQAGEGHSKQLRSTRAEGVDDDHLCYESSGYNYITKVTDDMDSSHRDAPSTPEKYREATSGPDSDGWLASIREESQS